MRKTNERRERERESEKDKRKERKERKSQQHSMYECRVINFYTFTIIYLLRIGIAKHSIETV